jgi:hypothetical protein
MNLTKSIPTFKKSVSSVQVFMYDLFNVSVYIVVKSAFTDTSLTSPPIYKHSTACSPDDSSGGTSTCALVTITVHIQTSLSTDGLRDMIGGEIMFVTNSNKFMDGLNDEVGSCDGTVAPSPSPTLRPTLYLTVVYYYTFDIEYSITCIDDYLKNEMTMVLDDILSQHASYEIDPNIQEIREYDLFNVSVVAVVIKI